MSISLRSKVIFARAATALGVLAMAGGGAAWWSSPDAGRRRKRALSPPPSAGPGHDVLRRRRRAGWRRPSSPSRSRRRPAFEPTSGIPDDPFFRRFFGDRLPAPERQPRQRGLGSGVIIEADGRIVTNAHVVDGADRVRVLLTDGREFDAKVVGVDKPTDLAVLDVEATGLPALPFGDSDKPRVGDVVLAVGNPLGVGQTVTMGILSAKGRATGAGDGSYEDFLQTDAPINQGNSGGALVTAQGRADRHQLADPEPVGRQHRHRLLDPGVDGAGTSSARSWITAKCAGRGMGVTIQPVTADIARSLNLPSVKGALVNGVEPGSPADTAGLKTGDVITKFNGAGARQRQRPAQPRRVDGARLEGDGDDRARRVAREDVAVQLANARRDARAHAAARARRDTDEGLGVAVEPLTPQLAEPASRCRATRTAWSSPTSTRTAGRPTPACAKATSSGRWTARPSARRPTCASALGGTADRPALVLVQRGEHDLLRHHCG